VIELGDRPLLMRLHQELGGKTERFAMALP
jgi:hypothetical protein